MFRNTFLALALAALPSVLTAQGSQSAPRDTSSMRFCRNFEYMVPHDTAARRDTSSVSRLVPKTDSSCARATTSQTRPTPRSQSSGAPRTAPRVVTQTRTIPEVVKTVPTESPRQSGAPAQHLTHITHSDTTVVSINLINPNVVDRGPSRFDRFFAHVERHKLVYGAVAVGLTVWCVKACGGDVNQTTNVNVNVP